ncbi:hypothetical protein [Streptomyces katrae]|nr:hypothetical protein [Streptomyces katrae]
MWFAGSAISYDLSLPRVRERFTPHVAPAERVITGTADDVMEHAYRLMTV